MGVGSILWQSPNGNRNVEVYWMGDAHYHHHHCHHSATEKKNVCRICKWSQKNFAFFNHNNYHFTNVCVAECLNFSLFFPWIIGPWSIFVKASMLYQSSVVRKIKFSMIYFVYHIPIPICTFAWILKPLNWYQPAEGKNSPFMCTFEQISCDFFSCITFNSQLYVDPVVSV